MSDQPSVRIIKKFTYRGDPLKQFSNRYHITGDLPDTQAKFDTLSDAIVAAEKLQFFSDVTIIQAVGYAPASDTPIWFKTYATAGTLAGTGTQQTPGDCAALVRYSTDQKTVKNHPLYLYNWYHGARCATGGVGDDLVTIQKNAMGTYATAWEGGFSDGASNHKRCGPRGAVALAHLVEAQIHHRDFPA